MGELENILKNNKDALHILYAHLSREHQITKLLQRQPTLTYEETKKYFKILIPETHKTIGSATEAYTKPATRTPEQKPRKQYLQTHQAQTQKIIKTIEQHLKQHGF